MSFGVVPGYLEKTSMVISLGHKSFASFGLCRWRRIVDLHADLQSIALSYFMLHLFSGSMYSSGTNAMP